MPAMQVIPIFHNETNTFTYVVTKDDEALIIDPVLDYSYELGRISFASLENLLEVIEKSRCKVLGVLDTHFHADHLTGSFYLKSKLGCPSIIGQGFLKNQAYFARIFGLEKVIAEGPKAYDQLVEHGQVISLGKFNIEAISVAGHTPSCMAYHIDDAVFLGDAVFMPKIGSGRTDFPGGSAYDLIHNLREHILSLPDDTRIFVGHDYPSGEAKPQNQTTVKETRQNNFMLNDNVSEEEFIVRRNERDKTLAPPRLMMQASQVNIFGGRLYFSDPHHKYLKLPLSVKPSPHFYI
jgi:glyoxylase-like metal-dependent hydrolase (beta-lactamase superfamily II)